MASGQLSRITVLKVFPLFQTKANKYLRLLGKKTAKANKFIYSFVQSLYYGPLCSLSFSGKQAPKRS